MLAGVPGHKIHQAHRQFIERWNSALHRFGGKLVITSEELQPIFAGSSPNDPYIQRGLLFKYFMDRLCYSIAPDNKQQVYWRIAFPLPKEEKQFNVEFSYAVPESIAIDGPDLQRMIDLEIFSDLLPGMDSLRGESSILYRHLIELPLPIENKISCYVYAPNARIWPEFPPTWYEIAYPLYMEEPVDRFYKLENGNIAFRGTKEQRDKYLATNGAPKNVFLGVDYGKTFDYTRLAFLKVNKDGVIRYQSLFDIEAESRAFLHPAQKKVLDEIIEDANEESKAMCQLCQQELATDKVNEVEVCKDCAETLGVNSTRDLAAKEKLNQEVDILAAGGNPWAQKS